MFLINRKPKKKRREVNLKWVKERNKLGNSFGEERERERGTNKKIGTNCLNNNKIKLKKKIRYSRRRSAKTGIRETGKNGDEISVEI